MTGVPIILHYDEMYDGLDILRVLWMYPSANVVPVYVKGGDDEAGTYRIRLQKHRTITCTPLAGQTPSFDSVC